MPPNVAGADRALPPVKFGDVARQEELGRGAFGSVFACTRDSDGERVAAKAIDLRKLKLSKNVGYELKKLRREAKILKQLPPHPNVVRFFDAIQEGNWLFFMMELVAGGNLFDAFVRRPGKRPRLQEVEACYVFRQLVEGLGWLHLYGIIHRDFKLENVLVVSEVADASYVFLDVKIADFGLSKVVGEGLSEARTTVGSPRYMAPEVLATGLHDHRADLWSLGVLIHVLLDGHFPFDGEASKMPQSKIDAALAKLPVSANARSAVGGLLKKDPEHRLTVEGLRAHAWISADGVGPASGKSQKAPGKSSASARVGKNTAKAKASPGKRKAVKEAVGSGKSHSLKSPRSVSNGSAGSRFFCDAEEAAMETAAAEVVQACTSPIVVKRKLKRARS